LYSSQIVSSGKLKLSNSIISPQQYAGTWYVNNAPALSGSDLTFTPSQMTIDTASPNINASALLSGNTSYFAIAAPVTGVYAFCFTSRGNTGNLTFSGSQVFQTAVWTYIGLHKYNGTNISNLGTAPPVQNRPGMQQMTYATPSSNNTTYVFHQSATPTILLSAGDIVAPWIGGGIGNSAGSLDVSTSVNKLTVTLLKQTA